MEIIEKEDCMKKKLIGIICCLFLATGCLGIGKQEDAARARVAVKNAKSVISSIRYNYTLDKLSTPVGTPIDILTIAKAELKVQSGTYTILSETADSDESQIRIDNVIIDGHTCSGTKNELVCTKLENQE